MKKLLWLPLAAAFSPCVHADDVVFQGSMEYSTACVPDATRTRMSTINVGYSVSNIGSLTVDATEFEGVFGRASVYDPTTLAFPGVSGTGPVFHWIAPYMYYSARFHTPPGGHWIGSLAFQSNDSRGCYNVGGSRGRCGQPYYDVSISHTCNDYSSSASYAHTNVPSDQLPHLGWSQGYGDFDLSPDTDYYLNIRMTDPADYWHTAYMIWYGYQQR